ncbi:sodium:solute symporter [Corynebacterium sp. HMSC05H05]|uniref:sodium:solute symporter family transporter n=1 Tax=Corynebacterium sp. HMSC05H05 TaxID=1581119 RepID=UPI0008A48B39|nr:sodium:solute symporter [Corynebacterium sp. HMSC05H05]OFT59529.1 sodium:solute symporter [Corynebacterium sp. HMSC05H05]
MSWTDAAVVIAYLIGMIGFGIWGSCQAKNSSDYLVAGRRLGPLIYTGTMVAVVLGGASAVGGVGLGYEYGVSGLWLVTAIGVGVLILSLVFAPQLQRLKIYTVVQMLTLRYGTESIQVASVVMLAYTLMLTATSTGAYASIFVVLFGIDRWLAILIGGSIVLIYSTLGGMLSITMADFVQFIIMTVGTFFLMLPFGLHHAGGWSGMQERLGAEFFDIGGIGLQSIITYFVIYTLGLLIGQDVWQRVFAARSPEVARTGGVAAGIYIILFGVAGAIAGMAAAVALPGIEVRDEVYARIATDLLPVGLGGIALAAAVAAMMSTASGGLIAAAAVARTDVMPLIRQILAGKLPRTLTAEQAAEQARDNAERGDDVENDMRRNRIWVLFLGVVTMLLSLIVPDVVAALTVAYDILVGGLLIAIVGGLVWKRGTGLGATWSMITGSLVTVGSLIYLEVTAENRFDGIYANEPIYAGLATSLVVYVVVSLAGKPTRDDVLQAWDHRAKYGALDEAAG